jgi:hypothetical protein
MARRWTPQRMAKGARERHARVWLLASVGSGRNARSGGRCRFVVCPSGAVRHRSGGQWRRDRAPKDARSRGRASGQPVMGLGYLSGCNRPWIPGDEAWHKSRVWPIVIGERGR